ncbi:MAG: glutamate-1-semialdehyde 2,1-aminomutase [Armatimonadetes bacterium]|nr:glutamate-1-semialdehyde 2,1-aminomutase [Armatimonadota bacterium]
MKAPVRSRALFEEAKQYIPGGVNSPVRAFRSVGGDPLFIARAEGSRIYDADGNEFIDYVGSWGPMALGHAHPRVIESVREALSRGTSYGAPTENEVRIAREICRAFPSVEMVRLVSSGTEAAMSALRLARGATGKEKIVKFEGCYHGHADSLLAKAGSGVATLGLPDSPGVPQGLASLTITLPYNDLEAVKSALEQEADRIACIAVEPVAGNMGVVPPQPGFLEGLRELTRQHEVLLLFDEVITGFRVAYGGAQERYGIDPDITILGKIIGGGFPVGAYGGKRGVMERIAPVGPIYQAGTLSGNPIAVTAGLATLSILAGPGVYDRLEASAAALEAGLREAARASGVPAAFNRVGSMMTTFFTGSPVSDYASAKRSDAARYAAYFRALLEEGIYLAPSQFEAAFVSLAHSEEDIDRTIAAARKAFAAVR